MEKNTKTTIHGFEVEVDITMEDGEPRSNCWIESPCGHYCSSLGVMEDFGHLEANGGMGVEDPTLSVPEYTQKLIREFADKNGY